LHRRNSTKQQRSWDWTRVHAVLREPNEGTSRVSAVRWTMAP